MLDTYTTDKIVTVPVTKPTQQVKSVTNLTLFKVLEQAQKQADNMLEQDPTASRHYVACAKIYADLCALYYAHADADSHAPTHTDTPTSNHNPVGRAHTSVQPRPAGGKRKRKRKRTFPSVSPSICPTALPHHAHSHTSCRAFPACMGPQPPKLQL